MLLRWLKAPIRLVVWVGLFTAPLAAQSVPAASIPGEPFTATVEQLRALSGAVPVDPQHAAEILYEEGVFHVNGDGTVEYRHRMVYRVDAQEAVERLVRDCDGVGPVGG